MNNLKKYDIVKVVVCAARGLEVMEGLLTSAAEGRFYHVQSACQRPEPLPTNFPDS